jgi:hypothetical protein
LGGIEINRDLEPQADDIAMESKMDAGVELESQRVAAKGSTRTSMEF